MSANWNISGLIIEGICGTGKTTLFRSLLRSEPFAQRSFLSGVTLSEHQTQRALERKEREAGLTPEDNLGLLNQHVSYLEALRDRLDRMEWCANSGTNMRVPFVLERFHFTHVCHYPHMTWEHVEGIDRRLAGLNCKVCLLTMPDHLLGERIITTRNKAWREYLSRHGHTDEEILRHYAHQQQHLLNLRGLSTLDTLTIDTADTSAEQAVRQALDFWGAI